MDELEAAAAVLAMDVEPESDEEPEVPAPGGRRQPAGAFEPSEANSTDTIGEAEPCDVEDGKAQVSADPTQPRTSKSTQ